MRIGISILLKIAVKYRRYFIKPPLDIVPIYYVGTETNGQPSISMETSIGTISKNYFH